MVSYSKRSQVLVKSSINLVSIQENMCWSAIDGRKVANSELKRDYACRAIAW